MLTKGYLTGSDGEVLCFRSSSGLVIGRYDWRPSAYFVSSGDAIEKLYAELKSPMTVNVRGKPRQVEFSIGKPMRTLRPVGVKKVDSVSGKKKTIYVPGEALPAIVESNDVRTAFIDFVENLYEVECPDSILPRPKDVRLFADNDLRFGAEYEIEYEEPDVSDLVEVAAVLKSMPADPVAAIISKMSVSKTSAEKIYKQALQKLNPDGTPILEIHSLKPTGNLAEGIRVAVIDEESALRNEGGLKTLDSVAIGIATPEATQIFTYRPQNFSGTAKEFRENFLDQHFEPEVRGNIFIAESKDEMYKEFERAFEKACVSSDIVAHYNGRAYDIPQIRRQISGRRLKGKAGRDFFYKAIKTEADDGVQCDLTGGLTDVLDLYLEIERTTGIRSSRKKLKTFERLTGIERSEDFHAADSGRAMLGHADFYKVIEHLRQDIENEKKLTEKISTKLIGQPFSARRAGISGEKNLAAYLFESFVKSLGLYPGIPVSRGFIERVPELGALSDNSEFFWLDLGDEPETVDIARFNLETETIRGMNISPETLWCRHYGHTSGNTAGAVVRSRSGKTYNAEFCGSVKGVFPRFLESLSPEIRADAAQLLRDPIDGAYCFSEPIALALRKKARESLDGFVNNCAEARIVELDRVFLSDYDSAAQKYPTLIGEKLESRTRAIRIPPTKINPNERGYVYEKNGFPVVVGARLHRDFFPPLLNSAIDRALTERLHGKSAREIRKIMESGIDFARPEEFVISFTSDRKANAFIGKGKESRYKKGMLMLYEEKMRARNPAALMQVEGDQFLAHVSGVWTTQGLKLVEEMDEHGWKNIDREFYRSLISPVISRILPGGSGLKSGRMEVSTSRPRTNQSRLF